MAKTDFSNGTVVTSTWLDSHYLTDGGHKHDGQDDDGHAQKINLSAEVTGTLPLANLETPGSDDVTNDSTLSGANVSDVLEGLDSNDIGNLSTATGSDVTAALNDHETRLDNHDGDVVVTSGILKLFGFSADQNVNFLGYFRTYRGSSNDMVIVELWLPEVYATSTDQYLGFTSGDIPANLRPDVDQKVHVLCFDNSGNTPLHCVLSVNQTGAWDIHRSDGSIFTSSGNKGIAAQIVRYRKSVS